MPAYRWRVALALLLTAAVGAGGVFAARRLYEAPGPLPAELAVVVPRGGGAEVAAALVEAGVIEAALPFRAAAAASAEAGALRAGELAFPAHASLRTVLAVLRAGRPVQRHLTIAEGLTAVQVAAVFNRADGLTGAIPPPAEAAVLPETYAYAFATPRASLLERATAAMDRALEQAWQARAPGLPLASPREALILASIVERETARPDERGRVAAVFLNRLRLGMRLQSDPTVVYAASGRTGVLDRPLTRADLDRDDPYNTYRIAGLPPGPICAPGLASLQAVLQPATTDELYFVADGAGGHSFARTLPDHNRNVSRLRALP